jgi:hypothetical protein
MWKLNEIMKFEKEELMKKNEAVLKEKEDLIKQRVKLNFSNFKGQQFKN